MTHIELIRVTELDLIIDEIKGQSYLGSSILEIGGGAGWQAKKLSETGFAVESIDMPQSIYSEMRVWPITNYDGKLIPFPNNHFDIIFSSSVLEHIPHLAEFHSEMKRVLKPDGLALHIVPSGAWRFWTSLAHYPFIIKTLLKMVLVKFVGSIDRTIFNEMETLALAQKKRLSKLELLKKAMVPPRHGEKGTALSEIYYFSRKRWLGLFKESGWHVEKAFSNRLMYTGHMILGRLLSIPCRKKLSYFLGSACHIFILRKPRAENGE